MTSTVFDLNSFKLIVFVFPGRISLIMIFFSLFLRTFSIAIFGISCLLDEEFDVVHSMDYKDDFLIIAVFKCDRCKRYLENKKGEEKVRT